LGKKNWCPLLELQENTDIFSGVLRVKLCGTATNHWYVKELIQQSNTLSQKVLGACKRRSLGIESRNSSISIK